MPFMDGLSAARIIRECESTSNQPIIAVSAHGQDYYRQAIEAGCSELINKPINFDEFYSIIERHLEPVASY